MSFLQIVGLIIKIIEISNGLSFFVKELTHLANLKKFGKSLYALYNRGYVGRKKEIDMTITGRNKKVYQYFLTEEDSNLNKRKDHQ